MKDKKRKIARKIERKEDEGEGSDFARCNCGKVKHVGGSKQRGPGVGFPPTPVNPLDL